MALTRLLRETNTGLRETERRLTKRVKSLDIAAVSDKCANR